MDGKRPARRSGWLLAIGLALSLAGGPACDGQERAAAASVSAISDEIMRSAQTVIQPRSADMESVGPEAAKRIYYQFIDDHGRVQFVERLSDVPAAWREQVGYVEMSQAPPLTPQQARQSWQVSSRRATEIMLANASTASNIRGLGPQAEEVILYYASWCGYCKKAQAHLDGADIRYELRDVDNPAIGRELREKTGRGGIPVLDFSGEILRGYSADAYDRAIRTIRG